jgi:hypothetical protein
VKYIFPIPFLLLLNKVKSQSVNDQDILYIPVVVHVVYANAEQNISNDQIFSQITSLNKDFNKANSDTIKVLPEFKSLISNSRIVFFLATTDPTGQPSSGITRTPTATAVFIDNDIFLTKNGGKDAWDTKKYLNIWICNLPEGIYGTGASPGTEEWKDGVVIDFQAFGTLGTATPPFNLGRTATHEIGHWLGLMHPWGIQGDCLDDDGVSDTPLQASKVTSCDLQHQSCGSLSLIQNFMQVVPDVCMHMFTKGQTRIMRENLVLKRNEVLSDGPVTSVTNVGKSDAMLTIESNDGHSFRINSREPMTSYYLIDISGRLIEEKRLNNPACSFEFKISEKSLYLLFVEYHNRVFKVKFIN